MRRVEVVQGTDEWMQARLGIPTASCFDRILTPKTKKPSGQRSKYMAELLSEWLMGQPLEWGTSGAVERGTSLEPEARRWYSMERDVDVDPVGFILRDDGLVGCSPDGFVGDDGGLEIKNPMALAHVHYMLGDIPEHTGQVQGGMYVAERDWWDVLSYNPDLPPVLIRAERDEEYLKALVPVLDEFVGRLEEAKKKFADYRVLRPWSPEMKAEMEAANAM